MPTGAQAEARWCSMGVACYTFLSFISAVPYPSV